VDGAAPSAQCAAKKIAKTARLQHFDRLAFASLYRVADRVLDILF
jgi:hypothetical protein